MVQAQACGRIPLSAILTCVRIAREQVASVELDALPGKARERQNPNDPWDSHVGPDCADPVVFVGFEFVFESAQLCPVGKVIGGVPTILNVENLRDRVVLSIALTQQNERAPRADHP
jgi:hypothetical protein